MKKNTLMKNVTLAVATIFTVQFSATGFASAQTVNPITVGASGIVVKAFAEGLQTEYSEIKLSSGDSETIKLTYNGRTLDNSRADWDTTDSSIASVKNGVITAKDSGTAYIIASYDDDYVYIIVNVSKEGSLKADTDSISMKKGDDKTITLKYNNKTISGYDATWTTSNTAVATVRNGVITANSSGTATITAKYNGQSVKITVKVNASSSEDLKASDTKLSMSSGDKETITLTYDGDKIAGSKATWKTFNTAVATVNDGVITANKKGTTKIRAEYKGSKVDIEVTVDDKDTKSKLKADETKVNLKKGKKETIRLMYNGDGISGSKATWKTSNSSVATVDDGVITAKGKGTATITASYKSESVKIEVKVDTADSSDGLEADETKISLKKGKKETIRLTYDGDSISGSKATWKTSNSSIATVDDGVITAKGKGTATITASYKSESVKIEVKVDTGDSSDGLEADETKLNLKKGKKETIRLTYDGDKISGSKATWKTSKSSVATVDDGVVTAKAKGTATITATYKSESVKIEVIVDGAGSSDMLEASKSKLNLSKGDKETIKLKYDGSSLTGSKASWSTSKSSVASVNDDGVVTAKAKGTATITAKYKGEEVEIEVNVDGKGSSSDSLEADVTSLTLSKGDKETIELLYNNKSLPGSKAEWSSSKTSVATVNENGRVTAKARGTATITAEYKGEKVKIKVEVE
ncbi:Ig-like domain-containing protein [Brevibacillus reuszeri]|uniref:Ig-like domain-containing protein n=1 Tax=Brevibacillus reuszeri TaxID=54915 RepID=UPI002898759B|nr:Ig-like domain-containing protein [Brevibacillus reuszeri]